MHRVKSNSESLSVPRRYYFLGCFINAMNLSSFLIMSKNISRSAMSIYLSSNSNAFSKSTKVVTVIEFFVRMVTRLLRLAA
jgi:hypothetical protein